MVLLLSTIISRQGYWYPSTYQTVIYFGQLLLIPGLAAVFSRIMYGPYGWARRTLTILLVGAFLGPVSIFALAIPMLLLAWAFDLNRFLFDFLLPVIVGGMVVGLLVAVRKSGKWGVQAEAARWLAERQSGIDPRKRRWRNRGILMASWIPLTLVMLVFLFLPEVWGVLSHFNQPRLINLPGYQVPIPATWIVLNYKNEPENGWSSLTGLAGRGIGRGIRTYLRLQPPISSWDVGTEPYKQTEDSVVRRWMPKDDEVVSRRSFTIGTDIVTCLDYWPSYLRTGPYQQPQKFEDSSIAYVRCSDGKRFYAGIFGPRKQVGTFYEMVGGTTPAK